MFEVLVKCLRMLNEVIFVILEVAKSREWSDVCLEAKRNQVQEK